MPLLRLEFSDRKGRQIRAAPIPSVVPRGNRTTPRDLLGVVSRSNVGAPDGTRTHDLQVRNLALYPLSYGRTLDFAEDWRRGRDLNPRRL